MWRLLVHLVEMFSFRDRPEVQRAEEMVNTKHEQVLEVMERKGLIGGYEEMADRYAGRDGKDS
jgi:hypothetical protein